MTRSSGPHHTVRWHAFDTPLGRTHAAATEQGLCSITWRVRGSREFERDLAGRFPGRAIVHDPDALKDTEQELRQYFGGARRSFDLPVDLSELTDFERRVLSATQRVPFGSRLAYSDVARKIGQPRAARAVGNALRRNPVPIVVPCHRVVRADGSLGGYAGPDGTPEKRRLLDLEART